MIIYHGSMVIVEKPKILKSEWFLDFGTGFYTTTSYEQAARWAKIKMRRENKSVGYISVYEFDFESAKKSLSVIQYDSADEIWLKFVTNNRKGLVTENTADINIGPVADDNVYRSIRLFETGVLDAEETVKRLKSEKLQDQWTFHTDEAISLLKFIKSDEIKEDTL